MEIISCEWAVHKLNLHLTSQICQFGERVMRVPFFFFFPLEEISLAPAPCSPLPLSNRERLFHIVVLSRRKVVLFSLVICRVCKKARELAPVALQDDLGVKSNDPVIHLQTVRVCL